jgi:hypothetical protein
MSEQQVETSIETTFEPDSDGKVKPQSSEDKFFGVKTQINNNNEEKVEVEVVNEDEQQQEEVVEEAQEQPQDDDAIDAEISDISKRAGDRINKIKYQYHEERRAKEKINKEKEEAVKASKSLLQENQKLREAIKQGGELIKNQAQANADFALQQAQENYKKAFDEGDTQAMADAQAQIAKASYAQQQAPSYASAIESQVPASVVPEQINADAQNQLDPAMKEWSSRNPWFMGTSPEQKEMTAYSLFLDEKIRASGINPQTESDKYYASVDEGMKQQFPTYFGIVQPSAEAKDVIDPSSERRQPSNVVAPVTRDTGKKPRNVRLSETQVKLARQLGITPEQYARQILKEA